MINLQMSHYIILMTETIFTAIICSSDNTLTHDFGKGGHAGNG